MEMIDDTNQEKTSTHQPIRVLFMGTPEFCIPTLDTLKALRDIMLIGVVTAPDRPVGRKQVVTPPPVKVWAGQNNVPVLQPEEVRDTTFLTKIKDLLPDVIVVLAYGHIIPKEILDIPPKNALNIHPSLLPKYRGASPIQYAILNGEKETGVTIIRMDEKIDHGPIIAQTQVTLADGETYHTLSDRLKSESARLIAHILPEWIEGKLQETPQIEGNATYTKILTREDGRIIWDRDAEELERQIRAFHPWPGSFTEWEMRHGDLVKIKILEVEIFDGQYPQNLSYGQVFLNDAGGLTVNTGGGALMLKTLQVASKTPMSAKDFLNGYQGILGAILI